MGYKLHICLIPSSAYGQNMRSVLRAGDWNKISSFTREIGICAGCNRIVSPSDLEAHEEWEFKDGKQKVKHIVPLCKKCHRSVHIGRAIHCGRFKKAAKWIKKVRKLSSKDFNKMYNNAWTKRSKQDGRKYILVSTLDDAWKIAKKDRIWLEEKIKKHPPKEK